MIVFVQSKYIVSHSNSDFIDLASIQLQHNSPNNSKAVSHLRSWLEPFQQPIEQSIQGHQKHEEPESSRGKSLHIWGIRKSWGYIPGDTQIAGWFRMENSV